MREKLIQALARGYCTKRNEKKILDPDLIEDMVIEALTALREELGEIVICAAIKYKDGTIIRGHRHGDCAYDCNRPLKKDFEGHIQGFITSRNRFVDRKEGMKIQKAAGIPSAWEEDGHYGDILFSEDLY